MKKTTKRAASVLLAAAMCMPAVTSVAAVEGVNYDDYYCARLELNDLEIPAYGNGEYRVYDWGFAYQYDEDTLLSMISGSATWESYAGTDEFTETFDNLAAYTAQHDNYVGFSGSPCYQKDGIDVEVWYSGMTLITDSLHITLKPTQPLVTDLTVSDCEIVKGSYELKPDFSFTLADGTTCHRGDSIFRREGEVEGESYYVNPLEFDFGGKDLSELEIGTYTVTARVLDAETTFRLTVKEQPDIADITFESLVFDELLDKKTTLRMSEIRFVDGTSIKPLRTLNFNWQSVEDYTYRSSKIEPPLQLGITVDDDPWTIGEHPLTIRHGSFCKTYTYRVEPSVVKSIVADDIVLSEAESVPTKSYGSNDEITYFNCFCDYRPRITITLQDGTTQVIPENHNVGDWDIDDAIFQWIWIADDQSAENPWTVGEHTATASLSAERSEESVIVPFKVIVTKSPVTSIAVDDITVGYESFVSGATGTYYKFNPKVNVQMEDGTTAVLSPNEVFTWQNRDYRVTLSDMNGMYYTSENYPLSPDAYGVHIFHAHFMGKTVPFKVTVNGLKTLCLDNITDNGDSLTIAYTAQKADGTVCTGSFTADKPEPFYECTAHDENLGSFALAYDYAYKLRIGGWEIPLTTGEPHTLIGDVGDADGDGTVTIQDATLIQRYLAEFGDVSLNRNEYPESFYAADVNSNGKIDIGDVTALQRMLAA